MRATVATMVVGVLLLWAAPMSTPPEPVVPLALQSVDVQLDGAVYRVPAARWREAFERTMAVLSEREQAAMRAMEADLDREVGQVWRLPRERVVDVADWYYSVPGQAARVGLAVADRFDSDGEPAARLLTAIGARLFPGDAWQEGQAQLALRVAELGAEHGQRALADARRTLHAELAAFRIDLPATHEPIPLSFDDGAGSGGILTHALDADAVIRQHGFALSSAALAGVAARRVAQAGAARAGGRALAGSASAACAGAGPLAAACVAGAFVGTLALSELALLRFDEARNRASLEAALHAELDRLEAELADGLRVAALDGMAEAFVQRRSIIDRQVRPIDLILRPDS